MTSPDARSTPCKCLELVVCVHELTLNTQLTLYQSAGYLWMAKKGREFKIPSVAYNDSWKSRVSSPPGRAKVALTHNK